MQLERCEVEGTVLEDGRLELDDRITLPAGRVRVTVQSMHQVSVPNPARFLSLMEQIWADQKSRGHVPRSPDEIDAEIKRLRDDAEDDLRETERLHQDGWKTSEVENGRSKE